MSASATTINEDVQKKVIVVHIPYEQFIAQARSEPGASIYRLEQLIAEFKLANPHCMELDGSPFTREEQVVMATILREKSTPAEWHGILASRTLNGYLNHPCNFYDRVMVNQWDLSAYPDLAQRLAFVAARTQQQK